MNSQMARLVFTVAAFVLAGFCVVSGLLFHLHPGNPGQMINFLKNLAMAGGFLQLWAVGGGRWSLDALSGRSRSETSPVQASA